MIVKELFAKLGLDVDLAAFQKADTMLGGLKAGLTVVTAMVTGAAAGLVTLVTHTADVASGLSKTAQIAGVTTDAIQELAFAGGKSVEEMSETLVHLARHMQAAKDGATEQQKAFAQAGVRVTEANGALRDSGDVLQDLADHFKALPDGTDKTTLAMRLFGKTGAELIPFLNKGGDGIQALRDKAQSLGVVLGEDVIADGKAFNKSLRELSQTTAGLANQIAAPLLKPAKEFVDMLVKWRLQNRELIKSRLDSAVKLLVVIVKAALVPLRILFKVLDAITSQWKILAALLMSIVLAAILTNTSALYTLALANIRAGAAAAIAGVRAAAAWALANAPVILLAALFLALILIADDVAAALRGDNSVLQEFLGNWKDDQPGEAWWMRDLKALTYLLLHFGPVIDFWKGEFTKLWEWLRDGFTDTWNDVVVGLKKFFHIDSASDKFSSERKAHYKQGYTSDRGLGPGEWRTTEDGINLFYPTTTPEEAARQGSRGGKSSMNTTVNQTINAAPGQSPAEVAGAARDQLDQWHQDQLDAANAAFGVPGI